MNILILGCGRVGASLAEILVREKHNVTILDKNPKAFHRLKPGFEGRTVVGNGFDRDILIDSGIERADSFVSVTNGDNTNIVAARIARDEFQVPKVITRIYDPRRAQIYRRLGIPTVASTTWASNKIKDLIVHPEFDTQVTFGNGEVELTRVEIPPQLVGKTVSQISIPGEIQVVAITRIGKSFIPVSGSIFEEGDVVRIAVSRPALGQLEEFLGLK